LFFTIASILVAILLKTFPKPLALPTVAACLALAYLLFAGFTATVGNSRDVPPSKPQTEAAGEALAAPSDFARIAEFHLFGQAAQTAKPKTSGRDGGVPETSLQLTLKGVVYFPNRFAHAIIEAAGQPQKKYRAGDTLPGGAVLHSIKSDRVILLNADQKESLALQKAKSEQPAPALDPVPAELEPEAAPAGVGSDFVDAYGNVIPAPEP
jgi:general secretion pathway protein C